MSVSISKYFRTFPKFSKLWTFWVFFAWKKDGNWVPRFPLFPTMAPIQSWITPCVCTGGAATISFEQFQTNLVGPQFRILNSQPFDLVFRKDYVGLNFGFTLCLQLSITFEQVACCCSRTVLGKFDNFLCTESFLERWLNKLSLEFRFCTK